MSLLQYPSSHSIFKRIDDLLHHPYKPSCSNQCSSSTITVTKEESIEKCTVCGKEYKSSGAMKMHERTHDPPCVCHKCGKAFSRPWLLKGHLRTHTGERPYECVECGRRFADRSNLRAHEHTHKSERKHKCSFCSQTFTRSHIMIKHEDSCKRREFIRKD